MLKKIVCFSCFSVFH